MNGETGFIITMEKEWCEGCQKQRNHEAMTLLEIKIKKCVVCGENK